MAKGSFKSVASSECSPTLCTSNHRCSSSPDSVACAILGEAFAFQGLEFAAQVLEERQALSSPRRAQVRRFGGEAYQVLAFDHAAREQLGRSRRVLPQQPPEKARRAPVAADDPRVQVAFRVAEGAVGRRRLLHELLRIQEQDRIRPQHRRNLAGSLAIQKHVAFASR